MGSYSSILSLPKTNPRKENDCLLSFKSSPPQPLLPFLYFPQETGTCTTNVVRSRTPHKKNDRKKEKNNKHRTSQVWLERRKKTKVIFSHPERCLKKDVFVQKEGIELERERLI